ncbi:uncharacterized protein JCM6883_001265 [Sporobolomyces salmoneus]|uniref:uncharacterized protein n=1 Tax=Sporobolomyces salmoneus TaxID=183962 RepID=UPI003182B713
MNLADIVNAEDVPPRRSHGVTQEIRQSPPHSSRSEREQTPSATLHGKRPASGSPHAPIARKTRGPTLTLETSHIPAPTHGIEDVTHHHDPLYKAINEISGLLDGTTLALDWRDSVWKPLSEARKYHFGEFDDDGAEAAEREKVVIRRLHKAKETLLESHTISDRVTAFRDGDVALPFEVLTDGIELPNLALPEISFFRTFTANLSWEIMTYEFPRHAKIPDRLLSDRFKVGIGHLRGMTSRHEVAKFWKVRPGDEDVFSVYREACDDWENIFKSLDNVEKKSKMIRLLEVVRRRMGSMINAKTIPPEEWHLWILSPCPPTSTLIDLFPAFIA